MAFELVAVLILDTIVAIREDGAPHPSRYVGSLVVFGMLALLAAAGPRWARLAGTFGGLVVLGIAVSPGTLTGPDGVRKPRGVETFEGLATAATGSTTPIDLGVIMAPAKPTVPTAGAGGIGTVARQ